MGSVLRLIAEQSNFFTKVTGVAVCVRALSEQAKKLFKTILHRQLNRSMLSFRRIPSREYGQRCLHLRKQHAMNLPAANYWVSEE
jgi:nicotinamide riboside kinase